MDLLKDRNSKLSAQVGVQRQEINRLQRTIDDLQEKEEERQETVLCVNRLWEELNGSIAFLSYRYALISDCLVPWTSSEKSLCHFFNLPASPSVFSSFLIYFPS